MSGDSMLGDITSEARTITRVLGGPERYRCAPSSRSVSETSAVERAIAVDLGASKRVLWRWRVGHSASMEEGSDSLREMDDRYLLPYRHLLVTQVRVDYALTLLLEGDASVCIEQSASLSVGSLRRPGAETRDLVPERQDVEAALDLFGSRVLSSVAFKSGGLRLVFDSGLHLNVPIDEMYEAWSARGPGSILVVSQPGGGLAIWK